MLGTAWNNSVESLQSEKLPRSIIQQRALAMSRGLEKPSSGRSAFSSLVDAIATMASTA